MTLFLPSSHDPSVTLRPKTEKPTNRLQRKWVRQVNQTLSEDETEWEGSGGIKQDRKVSRNISLLDGRTLDFSAVAVSYPKSGTACEDFLSRVPMRGYVVVGCSSFYYADMITGRGLPPCFYCSIGQYSVMWGWSLWTESCSALSSLEPHSVNKSPYKINTPMRP